MTSAPVGPRHLVQALVAGPGHDDVVARPEQHVHQAEDRLLGAGEGRGRRRRRSSRTARRSRVGAADGRSIRCSRARARPTAPGSRRRPARAARPSGSPGRPRRTGGARPRTPSARNSARGRSRRCASTHDGGTMPAMDPTHRHRRRADGARRPPVRDGAHAGRAARARAGRPRCARDRVWPASRSATPATWPSTPGSCPTPDPRAKNRARDLRVPAARARPRRRRSLATGPAADDARLLVLGGDCTAHAGAMAGLRRGPTRATPRDRLVRCPRRLQHARHDAVGQRLGDALRDAVRARRPGPRRRRRRPDASTEQDAALLGGQVLDEAESRTIAASRIAHFGAGMLGTPAGIAALAGWAARGRRARSTRSTSRSTWIASTHRAAGR